MTTHTPHARTIPDGIPVYRAAVQDDGRAIVCLLCANHTDSRAERGIFRATANYTVLGSYLLHLRSSVCAKKMETGYLLQLGNNGLLWRPIFVEDSEPPVISLTKETRREPGEIKGVTAHEAHRLFCQGHPETVDFSDYTPKEAEPTHAMDAVVTALHAERHSLGKRKREVCFVIDSACLSSEECL